MPGAIGAAETGTWLEGMALGVKGSAFDGHRDLPSVCLAVGAETLGSPPRKGGMSSHHRPQAMYSFTYSKSPGLLSMPTFGGAIQLAN